MFLAVKRLMPQSLFGRAALILLIPMVLVQIMAAGFFINSHWRNVTDRLTDAVAGEIAMVEADLLQYGLSPQLQSRYARYFSLDVFAAPTSMDAATQSGLWFSIPRRSVYESLDRKLQSSFKFIDDGSDIHVILDIKSITVPVQVSFSRKRIYSGTTAVFLWWMSGSALLFFTIAVLFMRNQIRPIRRLAKAAEAFGRGQDVPRFRPQGALEVRRAAYAFMVMRERIRRQLVQRTEMLAGVSHDLRTPLTRMKLQLSMMPESDDTKGLSADIEQMKAMVDGYLDFARGEGKEETETVYLDEILNDLAAAARRGGGRVALAMPKKAIKLSARPQALRRCLSNLIHNAVKYGDVAYVSVVKRPASLEIVVEDDGPGIPKDKREDVFLPFRRLEESRNQDTGGVGLGLAIAKDIALSHGGNLHVDDSPQYKGARFLLRLPWGD